MIEKEIGNYDVKLFDDAEIETWKEVKETFYTVIRMNNESVQ